MNPKRAELLYHFGLSRNVPPIIGEYGYYHCKMTETYKYDVWWVGLEDTNMALSSSSNMACHFSSPIMCVCLKYTTCHGKIKRMKKIPGRGPDAVWSFVRKEEEDAQNPLYSKPLDDVNMRETVNMRWPLPRVYNSSAEDEEEEEKKDSGWKSGWKKRETRFRVLDVLTANAPAPKSVNSIMKRVKLKHRVVRAILHSSDFAEKVPYSAVGSGISWPRSLWRLVGSGISARTRLTNAAVEEIEAHEQREEYTRVLRLRAWLRRRALLENRQT